MYQMTKTPEGSKLKPLHLVALTRLNFSSSYTVAEPFSFIFNQHNSNYETHSHFSYFEAKSSPHTYSVIGELRIFTHDLFLLFFFPSPFGRRQAALRLYSRQIQIKSPLKCPVKDGHLTQKTEAKV